MEGLMIRKLPASDDQIGSGVNVTGPLQIGNDWPGTFFRGDESGDISDMLRRIADVLDEDAPPSYKGPSPCAMYLIELADQFSACQI
jgi:hypothetical protein